jgi:tetratricopeptide (TPR) repeat protein
MTYMPKAIVTWFVSSLFLTAGAPALEQARALFDRTEYQQSLNLLLADSHKDAATLQLVGQNYFMLGEYKKSTDALEKAAALDPNNAKLFDWLGRAYGRRAETANPFTAPGYASKARQMFEKSVRLDPSNKEAAGDLLDFYLDAPGFLGGGSDKAETLAHQIGRYDPAEEHYAQAVIDDHRKDYAGAEEHFRRAIELAPRQASRFVSLARYLARHGKVKESDALFAQAASMDPNNPRVAFARAQTYIEQRRNLDQARVLLEKYLQATLTPDDPPREQAEALLKKIKS